MASEYWKRLESTLHRFTRKGDVLECVDVRRSDTARVCGLCSHSPIYWLHTLENLRSGRRLIVGSQCIVNYRRVYLEAFDEPLRIQVQEHMRPVAEKLNVKAPGAISIIPDGADANGGSWLDFSSYDEEDEDIDAELDSVGPDEGAPEGLGSDEIDWENPGIIQPHMPDDV